MVALSVLPEEEEGGNRARRRKKRTRDPSVSQSFFKIVSSALGTHATLDLSWFPDRARHAFGRRYADLYLITVQREPNYCDGWRDGIGEDHAVRCCSRGRVLRSLTKNAEFPNSLPILTFPTRRARWWHVLSLVEWRPCQLRSVWRTKWMVRA